MLCCLPTYLSTCLAVYLSIYPPPPPPSFRFVPFRVLFVLFLLFSFWLQQIILQIARCGLVSTTPISARSFTQLLKTTFWLTNLPLHHFFTSLHSFLFLFLPLPLSIDPFPCLFQLIPSLSLPSPFHPTQLYSTPLLRPFLQ